MNSNNTQNIPLLTEEEIRSHKKVFSSLSFSFLIYILLVQILAIVASAFIMGFYPSLLESGNFLIIFNSALQYCIGFPLLCLIIRKIPAQKPVPQKTGALTVVKYMLVGILIMYAGNAISTNLMLRLEALFGGEIENALSSMMISTDWYVNLLFVGIVGPIVEELMFRKLFIDRLSSYGDITAILFPSLVFGLFHGNLYQFFYAFALGAVFSYIYLKTGKIIYSILLHVFINVFCGVLPSMLLSSPGFNTLLEMAESGQPMDAAVIMDNIVPLVLLVLYEMAIFAMLIAGLVILIRNLRKIRLNKGRMRLPRGRAADIIFFNAGSVALIVICIILIALNTIPIA